MACLNGARPSRDGRYVDLGIGVDAERLASMEPVPRGTGDQFASDLRPFVTLGPQWSPSLAGREIPNVSIVARFCHSLNGARPSRDGRSMSIHAADGRSRKPQWSPSLAGREIWWLQTDPRSTTIQPQWSPSLAGREIPKPPARSPI